MFKRIRSENGFTLVELLVVLAILAILIAVVVPNLTGFLGKGKESSFEADRDTIQAAVAVYYTNSATANKWPTMTSDGTAGTGRGASSEAAGAYINFTLLDDLRLFESIPSSADSTYNTGGSATGSYGWYIDSYGTVQGGNDGNTVGFNGNYP